MTWKCVDCGKDVNAVVILDREKDLGRCLDCEGKRLLETFPPPPIEDMQMVNGTIQWPHHYIPRKCPYCNGEIESIFLGCQPNSDHVWKKHVCNKCGIDFGDTD